MPQMTPLFKISLHNLGEHYAGQRHFAKSFGWNSLGKSHADQQRFAKLFGWNDLKISLHNLGEHYAGRRRFAKSFGWNSLGKSHADQQRFAERFGWNDLNGSYASQQRFAKFFGWNGLNGPCANEHTIELILRRLGAADPHYENTASTSPDGPHYEDIQLRLSYPTPTSGNGDVKWRYTESSTCIRRPTNRASDNLPAKNTPQRTTVRA